MNRRRANVVSRPEHLTVSTEWQGLQPGDRVTVVGEGSFRFHEHVINTQSGNEWLTVGSEYGMRSFTPERVRALGASSLQDPFAAAVVQARKKLGLSRQTVADQCATGYGDICRIERGGKRRAGEEEKLTAFFEKLRITL